MQPREVGKRLESEEILHVRILSLDLYDWSVNKVISTDHRLPVDLARSAVVRRIVEEWS